ncbi:Ig-like domain-containing protein [Paenibacillus sp. RC21]|uniref:Ig-like domain-containing protein n=1 Tax=Paenibacillus sp. RC21 TaxID=3156312 RepID=UPI0038382401
MTHQPFKVTGIDRTMNGIIQLSCTLDSMNTAYDDVEHNIADRWKYEIAHTYALHIHQGTIAHVLLNETLSLKVTATDNGIPIENPAITYISSDPNVVSVDQQGQVMGIALGQASITAKLMYHPTVQSTIEVRGVETGTHIYSTAIIGNSVLKTGQSASYVSHIYDYGTEVFDQSVEWSLRNQDDSIPIMGSITASTGNSVTIKAGSSSGSSNKALILTATLVSDPSMTIEKTISLKNLF